MTEFDDKIPDRVVIKELIGQSLSPLKSDDIIGFAVDSLSSEGPFHGLRHLTTSSTSGWYIWKGDYSEDSDVFSPICFQDAKPYLQKIIHFLEMPSGWRFLTDLL